MALDNVPRLSPLPPPPPAPSTLTWVQHIQLGMCVCVCVCGVFSSFVPGLVGAVQSRTRATAQLVVACRKWGINIRPQAQALAAAHPVLPYPSLPCLASMLPMFFEYVRANISIPLQRQHFVMESVVAVVVAALGAVAVVMLLSSSLSWHVVMASINQPARRN